MSVHRRLLAMAFAVLAMAIAPDLAQAAEQGISIGLPAMTVKQASSGGQTYSLTLQVLLLMTALTLLPAVVLMMTAFTRIIIVLGILRQAIGAGQTPPNQVLLGLALFLTFFVMAPTFERINT
jgi:flagellar biosynthetic protein FliP